VLAAPAQAKKKNFGTQLTAAASSKNRVFTGNVIARAPCRANRRISVLGSGHRALAAEQHLAGADRPRQGEHPASHHFAAAKKRVIKRRSDTIVCRASSVTFDVIAVP
jgi:hypothetical protein